MNYKNDEFFDWFEQVIPKLELENTPSKKFLIILILTRSYNNC